MAKKNVSNNQVAPAPPSHREKKIKINTFFQPPPAPTPPPTPTMEPKETLYFFLPGSTEIFLGLFKTGDSETTANKKHTLFNKVAENINSGEFIISADAFCETEAQAFQQATKQFGTMGHAISIFKLVIPIDEINLKSIGINNITLETAAPDLLKYVESIKSFSTKKDVKDLEKAQTFNIEKPESVKPEHVSPAPGIK